MTELAGVVGDRFEVDRLAGEGGMGAVYRAWDRQSGSLVALKLLHPHRAEFGERFEREAKALGQLDLPGVVRLVDFGATDDQQPYLAMEWLEGESLAERLARSPLSVVETMQVCVLVSDALGKAHELGVVHRDLKPSNIFLVGGVLSRIKLLDFGLARLLDDSGDPLTGTGVLLGTPGFMAPEQVRAAKAVGPPADVYALGCVLFECLTGRPVFAKDDPMALVMSTLTDDPPRLASLRPEVPAELDALVAQLLSKRPADRPPDGGAVAQTLRGLGDAIFGSADALAAEAKATAMATAETIVAGSAPAAVGGADTVAVGTTPTAAAALGTAETVVASAGATTAPTIDAVDPATSLPLAAPSRPQPTLVDEPKPRVGRILAVVAIAVVVLASVWVAMKRAEIRDLVAARDKAWTPGPGSPFAEHRHCPFERCVPFDIERPQSLEPLAALGEATAFARSVEPQAQFAGMLIEEAVRGAVDLTDGGTVEFFFRKREDPDSPLMFVKVAHGSLLLERDGVEAPLDARVATPPRCRLMDAWNVAEPHALPQDAALRVRYHDVGAKMARPGALPAWHLEATDRGEQYWLVNGETCELVEAMLDPSR